MLFSNSCPWLEVTATVLQVSSLSWLFNAQGAKIETGIDGSLVHQVLSLGLLVGVDSEEGEREFPSS